MTGWQGWKSSQPGTFPLEWPRSDPFCHSEVSPSFLDGNEWDDFDHFPVRGVCRKKIRKKCGLLPNPPVTPRKDNFLSCFWSFLSYFRPFLTLFKTPNMRFGFLFTLLLTPSPLIPAYVICEQPVSPNGVCPIGISPIGVCPISPNRVNPMGLKKDAKKISGNNLVFKGRPYESK